jgi:sarcosine oxidase
MLSYPSISRTFDVIVVGLGAMGGAAAHHLAARGRRVLGLEQFAVGHDRGSSHGSSRIIRLAYFEHPAYVPLLVRAYALWRRLEHDSGRPLLTMTGGLMIGRPGSDVLAGSLRSAREHGLAHELLDATGIRKRFPAFAPSNDEQAVYETEAGVLRPEACVRAHVERAVAAGAEILERVQVTGWSAATGHDGVVLDTTAGRFEAGRLVLCPGAWAPAMFRLPALPLTVERQVLHWFAPAGGIGPFEPGRFPIYIWDCGHDVQVYGFPAQAGPPSGVKVAFFRSPTAEICTAQTVDRTVHREEIDRMRDALTTRLPALAAGDHVESVVCLYTLTPDRHFAIGVHPDHPQVTIASPCSGHGFKFASVIGAILADLVADGRTRHAIDLFDASRFAGG